MLHRPFAPGDLDALLGELLRSITAQRDRHDGIVRPVRHEDRGLAAGRRQPVSQRGAFKQIARKRHGARQPLLATQGRPERDRTPLGEAGQQQLFRRNAAVKLVLYQPLELAQRVGNALAVLVARDLEPHDVVPGPHSHAAVDRDRAHRGMRENEADRPGLRAAELRYNRREIVAVGPQPVEPDHGVIGIRTGLGDDAFKQFFSG